VVAVKFYRGFRIKSFQNNEKILNYVEITFPPRASLHTKAEFHSHAGKERMAASVCRTAIDGNPEPNGWFSKDI
jgi:hypothetical protein